jgi:hypothetical protein
MFYSHLPPGISVLDMKPHNICRGTRLRSPVPVIFSVPRDQPADASRCPPAAVTADSAIRITFRH